MAGTPAAENQTPYSSFPSFERTKLEIIDAFKYLLNSYGQESKQSQFPNTIGALQSWYFWIHGYTGQVKNNKLPEIKATIETPPFNGVIDRTKMGAMILTASEYMFELKITDVLREKMPDKFYLVKGVVVR